MTLINLCFNNVKSLFSYSFATLYLLMAASINAEELVLVENINTVKNASKSGVPMNLFYHDGFIYFAADNGEVGNEFWRYNTVSKASELLKDINQGLADANPNDFTLYHGKIYFSAKTEADGTELWVFDPALKQTQLVEDIYSGATSSLPAFLAVYNDKLYFKATKEDTGSELYRYDDAVGTVELVADINPDGSSGIKDITLYDNKLFFKAYESNVLGAELYQYDAVTNEVTLVADIKTGTEISNPNDFIVYDEVLFFQAEGDTGGVELWRYDSVTEEATIAADINADGDSSPNDFVIYNDAMYFMANDGSSGQELWKYTSLGGAELINDIIEGTSGSGPFGFFEYSGKLYFSAKTDGVGRELWRYDDATNTAELIKEFRTGNNGGSPSDFVTDGELLYFSATSDEDGTDIWQYGATEDTYAIAADVRDGSYDSSPRYLTAYNGNLYFTASDGITGHELYVHSPDTGLTEQVEDIRAGSNSSSPSYLTQYDDMLYFTANEGVNGKELWRYQSGSESPELVADINPDGSSDPADLIVYGDKLYFNAISDDNGEELHVFDVETYTTTRISDIATGSDDSNISFPVIFNDKLCFIATDSNDETNIWCYDQAVNELALLVDFPDGDNYDLDNLIVYQSKLYFEAYDEELSDYNLYVFDEVNGYTNLGLQGAPTDYSHLYIFDNKIVFNGYSDDFGSELWSYDPENHQYALLADINVGENGSSPSKFFAFKNKLYFDAATEEYNNELWVYDGVTAALVADIAPGDNASFPSYFAALNQQLYFNARNNNDGHELWRYTPDADSAPAFQENSPQLVEIDEDRGLQDFSLPLTVNDINGGLLTWGILTQAQNGSASIEDTTANTREIYYRSTDHYHGNDTFVVQVSDAQGLTAQITINVIINSVNDSPAGTLNIVGEAIDGNTLSISDQLTDADGIGLRSYQWLDDGNTVLAEGDSYRLSNDDVLKDIHVKASYLDNDGTLESINSSDVTVTFIAEADYDSDGLTNAEEDMAGLNMFNADTDFDGMGDAFEFNHGSDPLFNDANDDFDGDGLTNIQEMNLGTSIYTDDTDGDGVKDNIDDLPLNSSETVDTDGDGIGNNADNDDDGDGLPDSYELGYAFLSELTASDATEDHDGDSYSNLAEFHAVTDPEDVMSTPENSLFYKVISPEGSSSDAFSEKMAIYENTAMVSGELYDENFDVYRYIYVFNQSNGKWHQSQKLVSEAGEFFSGEVSIFGDTAMVAANSANGHIVYVYQQQDDKQWLLTDKLSPVDREVKNFGIAISIDQTIALIGAYGEDGEGNNSGAAYIFEQGNNGQWTQQQKLTADTVEFSDYFAKTLALSGNVAIIGASQDQSNGALAGAAYIFEQGEDQVWRQQQKIIPDDIGSSDHFGFSVDVDSDSETAIIGAFRTDDHGNSSGSSYIFERAIDGSWFELDKLTADDALADAQFGHSVAIKGDSALIGAWNDDEMAEASGAVYLFHKNEDGEWLQQEKLVAPDAAAEESFGTTVKLTADLYMVGTNLEDGDSFGSAYFISIDTDGDGIANNVDADKDNDGVNNEADAFPYDNSESTDTDGDGTGNNADTDDDGDGANDTDDTFPLDAAESVDTDGDGLGNNADNDDDNDGVIDALDHAPLDDEIGDVTAPVFGNISPVTINAQGQLTDISTALAVIANDLVDGEVPAVIVGDSMFASGQHIVDIKATDKSANVVFDTVVVNILPELTMIKQQNAVPGGSVNVVLSLSGEAPSYPVDVLYSVFVNDKAIDEAWVSMSSGTQADIIINLADDLTSTDAVIVNIDAVEGAFVEGNYQSQLVVIEHNVAPLVTVSLRQAGKPVSVIDPDKGLVTFTATVTDVNQADNHDISWLVDDAIFVDDAIDEDLLTFELNPKELADGMYSIDVMAVESNTAGNLFVSLKVPFIVEQLAILSAEQDSDNDGIVDSVEGYSDSDGDGIVDYLDNDDNTSRLPSGDNTPPLQTAPGLTMSLGTFVLSAKGSAGQQASLTLDDLTNAVGEDAASTQDEGFEITTPIYNFVISGLGEQGASASVIIALGEGELLPQNAVYRKYNTRDGWYNFVEDANNSVHSAPMDDNGYCPAINDDAYQPGLIAGYQCIQLTIEDGGANDIDFITNGSIEDPGAVAVLSAQVNTAPEISIVKHEAQYLESSKLTLSALASDAEGDSLTYQWQQLSGPAVSFVNRSNISTQITLPEVNQNAEVEIMLIVSDGLLEAEIKTSFIVANQVENKQTKSSTKSSGGVISYLFLLIFLTRLRSVKSLVA